MLGLLVALASRAERYGDHAGKVIAGQTASDKGGASFVVLQSDTAEDLRGLSVVSSQVAWASGTHGTYLRTGDGGSTWTVGHVAGASELDFRDVEGFSAEVAYLLAAGPGGKSRIYKTTNGGAEWMQQYVMQDGNGFLDCMGFWDREHGMVVGDPIAKQFFLLRTDDGGKQWERILPARMPEAMEGEGAFAASGTCLTVRGGEAWFATGGPGARVFHSGDRGQHWTASETPVVHGNASSGIFSIAFRDAKYGVAGGGDYKRAEMGGPNLAITEDGGRTWKLADISPQKYFSVSTWAGNGLIVAGSGGVGYTQEWPSKSWLLYENINLNAAGAADGLVLAVGPKGKIVKLRK